MNGKSPLLYIEDLHVSVEGKQILKGVTLQIDRGQVHAIMGPNGSGKSTLANALMGHPKYEITGGRIWFKGEDVTDLSPDERARRGMFMAFQHPIAVPGVTIMNFLRMALKYVRGQDVPAGEFRRLLREKMALLRMDESFATRYVNDGFSGGERKRAEILQMAMLQPELAILDETDTGLDIDALRIVSEGINSLVGPQMGVLIITHYIRILNYVQPQFVHVLYDGRIIMSGGADLAHELEQRGYDWVIGSAA